MRCHSAHSCVDCCDYQSVTRLVGYYHGSWEKLGNSTSETFELPLHLINGRGIESDCSVFQFVFDESCLVNSVLVSFERRSCQSSVECSRAQGFFDYVRRSVKKLHFWFFLDLDIESTTWIRYRPDEVRYSRIRIRWLSLSEKSVLLVEISFGIYLVDRDSLRLQEEANLLFNGWFFWVVHIIWLLLCAPWVRNRRISRDDQTNFDPSVEYVWWPIHHSEDIGWCFDSQQSSEWGVLSESSLFYAENTREFSLSVCLECMFS